MRLTYDTRTNMALFRSFTASDYVAAQRIRYDNFINIFTSLRKKIVPSHLTSQLIKSKHLRESKKFS